ncbi:CBS domain-containing protein [Candidatus Poribacteria bacterium]|nr:CBS domain-containing protein [Candidatus Poribacteria bacterium]
MQGGISDMKKSEYQNKVETRLDELDKKMRVIGDDVGKMEENVQQQYKKLRDPLHAKLEELRKILKELKTSSDAEWKDIKSGVEVALKDLEKGFDGLVSSMKNYISISDVKGDTKMKVSEIMTKHPKVCTPKDNVSVPIGIMWDFDCGDVPVVTSMDGKQLVGMVTDRDIAISVVKHHNASPSDVSVESCMSSPAISCKPDDSVETAIQLMAENKIRRIPVSDDDGCCVGILSQADILRQELDCETILSMLQQVSAPQK